MCERETKRENETIAIKKRRTGYPKMVDNTWWWLRCWCWCWWWWWWGGRREPTDSLSDSRRRSAGRFGCALPSLLASIFLPLFLFHLVLIHSSLILLLFGSGAHRTLLSLSFSRPDRKHCRPNRRRWRRGACDTFRFLFFLSFMTITITTTTTMK